MTLTLARRILVVIVVCLCVAGIAGARKRRAKKSARKVLETASGPLTVKLESVDIDASRAVALVGGVAREPEARLFTFHDDKDRHFIALGASCAAAGPSTMRCTLELPRPYLKRRVVAMTVHLKRREIEAPAGEVEKLFGEARERAVVPRSAPDGGAPEGTAPDGGVASLPSATHTSGIFEAPAWQPPAIDGGWSHEPVGEDTEEWHELKEKEDENRY